MSIFGDLDPIGAVGPEPQSYSHSPDQNTGSVVEDEQEDRPMSFFIASALLLFCLLVGRLLTLQVVQGQQNLTLAEGNRIRTKNTPAPRGIIFDHLANPLVKNVARYDLSLIPSDLPSRKKDRQEVYEAIKEKLHIPIDDHVETIETKGLYSTDPIILQPSLTQEKALEYEVLLQDIPGVVVLKEPIRLYTPDKGLGHILGYIGKVSQDDLKVSDEYRITDWIGKAGLEKQYEKEIKGINGQEQIEIDAHGHLQRIIASNDPQQGHNLYLNLDLKVQEAMYQALGQSLKDNKATKGTAIALNPQSGAVYGLVSLPDYDPNIFLSGDKERINDLFNNKDQPLLNRPLGGTYPPGSSIKPVYAAAGLQEKVISSTFTVDTPKEIKIGQFVFPDWKDHGKTDIRRALAESNNIIFYAIGGGWDKIKGLGIKKIDEYLDKFGFGERTGIDLPGEVAGFIPTPEWKKQKKKESWYIGDTYHLSIGQGDISVTPIRMAVITAAIANGGVLVTPHLGGHIDSVDKKRILDIASAPAKRDIIGGEELRVVREGMRQTVEYGSARSLNDLKGLNGQDVQAAGKTGTAQTGRGDRTHAWFIGFAPFNNPKIAFAVLVEDGGEGYTAAVPVAREIMKTFFRDDNPVSK